MSWEEWLVGGIVLIAGILLIRRLSREAAEGSCSCFKDPSKQCPSAKFEKEMKECPGECEKKSKDTTEVK